MSFEGFGFAQPRFAGRLRNPRRRLAVAGGRVVSGLVLGFVVAAALSPVGAQAQAARSSKPTLGFDSNSKDPVNVNADGLRVFVRDNKAVYTGNVIATRGDSTLSCSVLTVFYDGGPTAGATAGAPAAATPAARPASTGTPPTPGGGTSVKRMECTGPVRMVSKDQVATGDNGTFDNVANKVILIGNVVLAQGQNVTRGDRLDYDTSTGVANVTGRTGGRVGGVFVQGQEGPKPPAPAAPSRPAPAAGGTRASP